MGLPEAFRKNPADVRAQASILRRIFYPRKVRFPASRCPDCGAKDWGVRSSGTSGHEEEIKCAECGSQFGLNGAPFCMIQRTNGAPDDPRCDRSAAMQIQE